jgi:flavin reductase (DIM6/NTAB) family NADH-FMN oxidoreductase RutF
VVNLAPYSYFNAIADIPPMVMFAGAFKADEGQKDTVRNVEATGEFVVNMATYPLRDAVNQSSVPLPYGVSETDNFNIETTPSQLVKPPRVKASPIHLECRYVKTVSLDFESFTVSGQVVIGHVVGIHIDDAVLVDGKVNTLKLQLIARMGYHEYAVIQDIFKMNRLF